MGVRGCSEPREASSGFAAALAARHHDDSSADATWGGDSHVCTRCLRPHKRPSDSDQGLCGQTAWVELGNPGLAPATRWVSLTLSFPLCAVVIITAPIVVGCGVKEGAECMSSKEQSTSQGLVGDGEAYRCGCCRGSSAPSPPRSSEGRGEDSRGECFKAPAPSAAQTPAESKHLTDHSSYQ